MKTILTTRRDFIKTGIALTAGLPFLQACNHLTTDKASGDDLYNLFRNPPSSAKPFVRWWWNGSKVTAKEIVREIEVMHKAGIGGFEINTIAFPADADDLGIPSLTWLSPEWIEMVKTALKAAEERDMTCDIICGSGWPFGAEFLTHDERSQLMTITTLKVKGAEKITLKVADLLKDAKPEIDFAYKNPVSELYSLCLAPVAMDTFQPPLVVPFDKDKDKELVTVTVPDGEFILYALVKVTAFQAVIHGAPGALGPVMNHYNAQAVQKFLNNMSDHLFPALKGLKGIRAIFCDSMELEGANWCPDFIEEFIRRNGYDIAPYLPFILYKVGGLGLALDSGDITLVSSAAKEEIERARYDFFVTCMNIVSDRFLEPYTQWCNKNGCQSKVQAYGREFHPLDAAMKVDIPECETWFWSNDTDKDYFINTPSYACVNKFVASAVHLSGKKIVSCEEITSINTVFNATLERIKITGDQSNTSGVTHSVLHGFSYSPPEAPFPGWVRYGTFFNEKNLWWPYFKLWAAYKTRLSAVLQETDYFADIAVMHPLADLWTKHGTQRDPYPDLLYPRYQYEVWEAIHRHGNSCDYITEAILQQCTSERGFLKFNKRAYHTLLLLEVESMQPATAEALANFVNNGGKIIFVGQEPYKSSGMKDRQANDKKVKETITAMKQAHAKQLFRVDAPVSVDRKKEIEYYNIVPGNPDALMEWFGRVQQLCTIKPYIVFDKPNPYISQIRHQADGLDLFFVTNCSTDKRFVVQARFPVSKGYPWLWNPENGERTPHPGRINRNTLTIDLPPAGSQLIVFDEQARGGTAPVIPAEQPEGRELTGWTVRMQHINGTTEQREFSKLFNLIDDATTRAFAGYLYYEKQFVGDTSPFNWLDLGRVYGVSEVTLNGENLGCQWYGRHLYRIPEQLAKATNKTLQVKITTTLGNYLKSSPDNKVGYGWTKDQKWQPVGMIGPVKLV